MIHSEDTNIKNPDSWHTEGYSDYYLTHLLLPKLDKIYTNIPKICLVIGNYAAVPYIHLHLEMRKKHYPHIPILIHDDGSQETDELKSICKQYGADFEQNKPRLPPFLGDLMSFVGGLKWAKEKQCDILVKMSRRFIPLIDWSKSLTELALKSQYPTFSSWTKSYNYGFRTECLGMSVNEWYRFGHFQDIARQVYSGKKPNLVESYMHNLAKKLIPFFCHASKEYEKSIGKPHDDRTGYAEWDFMGTDRSVKNNNFLWHNSHEIQHYSSLSQSLGLPYTYCDFVDPNQGMGDATD